MVIKKMSTNHLKELVELEQECFSNPWSYAALESELYLENAVVFVAEDNNKVLGYMGMHQILDICYITNVAVFSINRNQGVGSELMKTAITYCTQNAVSELTLEVRKSNQTAIHFYVKFGFEILGERKNFYTLPNENALIMTMML